MAVANSKFDSKCKELFDKVTHNTGSLSFDQFHKALTENGVELSFTALQTQWNIIDTDGSDDMDLSEFKVLMKRHFEASDAKVILQKAFNSIYRTLMPHDPSDLLSYKAQTTRRVSYNNVMIPLNKRSMRQKKDFEKALEQKISDIFKLIDVDNSGTLELEEMWQAVQLLGIPISYGDLKLTYDFFDTDQNGCIEEPEFKRWMNSQITKYWADNPGDNQFVALQRAITSPESVEVLSTRASKAPTMFSFEDALVEQEEDKTEEFADCIVSDVKWWDVDKTCDFVGYLFQDKKYDDCRDKYVAIFMTNMIDGKKFMELGRRQIAHLGIVTKKGKRHVSVIRNAQRQIEERSK